ncbi:unnamed protein product [Macrosiphum euphorbiae]|uniref:LAGLIDADG homing endonuclease n=1 Tax=Macrosiphum euphorbiae TaxID=13131 RepID=A0AAV0WC01_9HEMI|nr:unnamed protein product [Macrosiphum euphorbiae]
MVYQDHPTKFVILRPLTHKRAEEVAYVLIDIFTTFGAPAILQSDMEGNSPIKLLLSCVVCGKNLRLSTESLDTHKVKGLLKGPTKIFKIFSQHG